MLEQISTFQFFYELFSDIHKNKDKFLSNKQDDKFLIYDSKKLKEYYSAEYNYEFLPYKIVYNFIDHLEKPIFDEKLVDITVAQTAFSLEQEKFAWDAVSREGFEALKTSGRISLFPEPLARVANAAVNDKNQLELLIEKADYFDQAKTNLILDYPNTGKSDLVSLRKQLLRDYPHSLPPWSDRRLGNTMGISCLLFYKNDDSWLPYLVRRERKVAVHPGGIQTTASGAAKWPEKIDQHARFNSFFINHMYNELYEEVGLRREDVANFIPVALCREFVRGGKPQLFFIGTTTLNASQLVEKRKKTRKLLEDQGAWKEISRDSILKKAQIAIHKKDIVPQLMKYKLSHEPFLLCYLAREYFARYSKYIEQPLNSQKSHQ